MGQHALRTLKFAAAAVCLVSVSAAAQVFVVGEKTATADAVTEFTPTHVSLPDQGLTEKGRRGLLQGLVAEQGFAHREMPLGAGLLLQANGNMTPRDEEYKKVLYKQGVSAQPGERVAVTAVDFKADRIVLDFNGGPYARHRFLSHIQLNDAPIAQRGPDVTGFRISLVFEGGIPEITAAEVKALLDPMIDFKAKSSQEAYADSLPPKIREAVAAHEVLVGMTKRMVQASLGQPKSKDREHINSADDDSPRFEEWIYGETPQPIKFVRFRGDRVVRLEIAELGKPVQIFEKNQVGSEVPTLNTRMIVNGDALPGEEGASRQAVAPTMRKPGEASPNAAPTGMGPVDITPRAKPPATDPQTHLLALNRSGN